MENTDSTAVFEASSIVPDPEKTLKRSFFKRILGKPATNAPSDEGCWTLAENELVIELSRVPELSEPGSAVRFEGESLPKRVLLVYGDDKRYYAFCNECTHGKRRLDPVPGAGTVQCCSVGKSTFDYSGERLAGSAKENIRVFPLRVEDGMVFVSLKE